ncbi:MAG: DUF2442 domain-containing protein [Ktedonobacteraceae bacterium]
MSQLVRVKAVKPLQQFRADVLFTDGSRREIDLEPYLQGPIFEKIRSDTEKFREMCVEGGTIAWPNGADIDPDVLYFGLRPAWTDVASSHDVGSQPFA